MHGLRIFFQVGSDGSFCFQGNVHCLFLVILLLREFNKCQKNVREVCVYGGGGGRLHLP